MNLLKIKTKSRCRLMKEYNGWNAKKGETVDNVEEDKRCNAKNTA